MRETERAGIADVVWEWQPLENGRIFSDPPVRTILKRGRTTASASFKPRIFDRDGVKYAEKRDSYYMNPKSLFYHELWIRYDSNFRYVS